MKNFRKLAAILLSLCMLMTSMPKVTFADEAVPDDSYIEIIQTGNDNEESIEALEADAPIDEYAVDNDGEEIVEEEIEEVPDSNDAELSVATEESVEETAADITEEVPEETNSDVTEAVEEPMTEEAVEESDSKEIEDVVDTATEETTEEEEETIEEAAEETAEEKVQITEQVVTFKIVGAAGQAIIYKNGVQINDYMFVPEYGSSDNGIIYGQDHLVYIPAVTGDQIRIELVATREKVSASLSENGEMHGVVEHDSNSADWVLFVGNEDVNAHLTLTILEQYDVSAMAGGTAVNLKLRPVSPSHFAYNDPIESGDSLVVVVPSPNTWLGSGYTVNYMTVYEGTPIYCAYMDGHNFAGQTVNYIGAVEDSLAQYKAWTGAAAAMNEGWLRAMVYALDHGYYSGGQSSISITMKSNVNYNYLRQYYALDISDLNGTTITLTDPNEMFLVTQYAIWYLQKMAISSGSTVSNWKYSLYEFYNTYTWNQPGSLRDVSNGRVLSAFLGQLINDACEAAANGYSDKDILLVNPSGTTTNNQLNQMYMIYKYLESSNGYLRARKVSSDSSLPGSNTNYSLKGAEFGVYTDLACTNKIGTLTSGDNGYTPTLEVEQGTYYIREDVAPKGFARDATPKSVTVTDANTETNPATVTVTDNPVKGYLRVHKTSANSSLPGTNSNYSLSGAQYGVYSDRNCTNLLQTLTTGSDGWTPLSAGYTLTTVYVKEISPSKGYDKNPSVVEVILTAGHTTTAPYVVNSVETPVYGYARVVKSSGDTTISGSNPAAYSLAGATFGVYTNSNCTGTPVATMTTIASGYTNMVSLPYGNYWVKETQAPSGFLRNNEIKPLTIDPTNTQNAPATVTVPETPKTGKISMTKVSAIPAMTNGNPCYSLADAQYEVKNSAGVVVGTLTTLADGSANVLENLPLGTYTAVETVPSKGYQLDPQPYTINLTADNYGTTQTFTSKEIPLNDPVVITVEKINATEGNDYDLSGTRFLIEYFNDYYTESELSGKTATRKWVIEAQKQSDGKYKAFLLNPFLVSALSDSLYLDSFGSAVVPLGTIRITEYSPATGFNLDPNIYDGDGNNYGTAYVAQVTADGINVSLNVGANRVDEAGFVISDSPIRGDFELYKKDERYRTAMANVDFLVERLAADGTPMIGDENKFNFTTDENGYFTTVGSDIWVGTDTVDHTLGALPFGNYRITELDCEANEAYEDHEPVYFTVVEHGGEPVRVDMDNHLLPLIGTTLVDSITDTHIAEASELLYHLDSVAYENTHIGDNYEIKGELLFLDGEPLVDINGEPVTGTSGLFQPTEEDGVAVVPFEFEVEEGILAGRTVVAFEYLYREGELVAQHTSLIDEDQWIHYGKLVTTASSDNGTHYALMAEDGVIHDDVVYENFIPGTYMFEGTLIARVPVYAEDEPEDEDTDVSDEPTENEGEEDSNEPTEPSENEDGGNTTDSTDPSDTEDEGNTDTGNTDNDTGNDNENDADVDEDEDEEEEEEEILGVFINGREVIGYEAVPTDIVVTDIVEITEETVNGTNRLDLPVDMTEYPDGTQFVVFERAYYLVLEEGSEEYTEQFVIAREENILEENQTIYVPQIRTTAWDAITGDHMALAEESATAMDRVSFFNLMIGEEVTNVVYLLDAEGNKIEQDGEIIINSQTFIPETHEGYVDVSINYNSLLLAGTTITIGEELYDKDGNLIASHMDPNNKDQQIFIPDLHTTFVDDETQSHTVSYTTELVDWTDTVEYGPVVVDGSTRRMRAYLLDKDTEEVVLDKDGEPYTAYKDFVPETPNGTVEVTFHDIEVEVMTRTIVCAEILTNEDETIVYAIHADLEDEDQTVRKLSVGTQAMDKTTGTEFALLSNEMTAVDTVKHENAVIDETYVEKAVLMIREEKVDEDGNVTVTMTDSGYSKTATVVAKEHDFESVVEIDYDGFKILPNGGVLVIYEYIYVNGVLVAEHCDPDSTTQRIIVPVVKTEATDTATQTHISNPNTPSTIKDDLLYSHLIPGLNYEVKTNFYDNEAEEFITNPDGTLASATTTFKPEKSEGIEPITFNIPAEISEKLAGKTITCFETVIYMGKVIAVHAEICDEQSIYFPSIKTTATVDGAKQFDKEKKEVTISDLAELGNLVISEGYLYELVGTAMDVATKEAMTRIIEVTVLDENGNETKVEKVVPATSSLIFTPTEKDSKITIDIPVSLKDWKGEDIVIFEVLYLLKDTGEVDENGKPIYERIEIARHEDWGDKDQTVSTAVNTGIADHLGVLAVGMAITFTAAVILFIKARRKEDDMA